MPQSLLEKKDSHKKNLQYQCKKIEAALKKIAPAYSFDSSSMENDKELIERCQHVYLFSMGDIMKLPALGVSHEAMELFQQTTNGFSYLLENIQLKINLLGPKSVM